MTAMFRVDSESDLKGLADFVLKFGTPCVLWVQESLRSIDQNRKLWPMLECISQQCQLPVCGGEPAWCDKYDWKDFFTAMYQGEGNTRWCPLPNGKIVFFGLRTSRLTKAQFSELIELIYAYGAIRDVVWNDPALKIYETYREAA